MKYRPLNCLDAAVYSACLYPGRQEGCNQLSWMQYRFDIALFIDCDTMDLGTLNDRILPPFEMWVNKILILRNCHHDLVHLFPLWLPSLLLLYQTDGHTPKHSSYSSILATRIEPFCFQSKVLHFRRRYINWATHWTPSRRWPWHSFLYCLCRNDQFLWLRGALPTCEVAVVTLAPREHWVTAITVQRLMSKYVSKGDC